jgi:hypothetical protein
MERLPDDPPSSWSLAAIRPTFTGRQRLHVGRNIAEFGCIVAFALVGIPTRVSALNCRRSVKLIASPPDPLPYLVAAQIQELHQLEPDQQPLELCWLATIVKDSSHCDLGNVVAAACLDLGYASRAALSRAHTYATRPKRLLDRIRRIWSWYGPQSPIGSVRVLSDADSVVRAVRAFSRHRCDVTLRNVLRSHDPERPVRTVDP